MLLYLLLILQKVLNLFYEKIQGLIFFDFLLEVQVNYLSLGRSEKILI